MRVISKTAVDEFIAKHPVTKSSLQIWYTLALKCKADDLASLKKTFGTVDYVPACFYVFNVGGNKCRVVAAIHFDRQKLFIRHVLTHKEYDAWTGKNRKK
ncbi:type II toxin-antitoxin system HigB family toxin [Burkholderia sp. Ac-20379]|uniref:type II toxin-antitoxin system HigB family toxin n=1 Tax=Burkholderia sp. Ac-20379 TaxID=2703900 RepID=UPI00197DE8F7|nr:type II toxin-antitoxin system HigB family toxin [Burkholderia sp. Ac-20379]MBN3724021.1 type II toxin-antitoxin system HigB family toxin [Burkholderia sp. Ac-20379]